MNKKERMHWVDIARGFFMIAIVLGHVFHSGYLRHWVFSYHVPAFFFLAGYCFKYIQDVQQFIKKKVRTIVIPYLIFSLMSIVLFAIAQLVMPKVGTLLECDLVTNFFVMLYGNSKPETMRYNLPLWFLPCFFCVTILAYIVEKLSRIKGRQIRYISMVIAAILGGMVGIYNTIALPWHFETAISMLVWYLAGITVREKQDYFCKKVDHFQKKGLIQIFGSVCMIIAGYGIAFLNNCTVGVRNDHYGIIPVYYLAAAL
ncbi:MAG: acyltransferase family protein, partial [Eubacteriales bacterium]|nr:acyltransferase family protein [Eubacteriales bacterium]